MYHALYSAAVDQLHARLPAFREHLRISAVRFTTDRERAAHLGGAELYVGPAVGRDESQENGLGIRRTLPLDFRIFRDYRQARPDSPAVIDDFECAAAQH